MPEPTVNAPPDGPQSALPPVLARALAFVAILVGGACGGVIGGAVTDVQCSGDCSTPSAIGGLVGAIVGAAGVAVVAVLALRAMGEWRTIEHGRAAQREYEMRAEDGRSPRLDYDPAAVRRQQLEAARRRAELEAGAAAEGRAGGASDAPPPGPDPGAN